MSAENPTALSTIETTIYRHYRLIHACKVSLAALLATALVFLGLPDGGWTVVTVVVVMGTAPFIGGVVDRSIQRFLGTVAAAICSWLIIASFGPHSETGTYVGIGLAVALSAYFARDAKIGYAATIFGFTVAVLLGFPGSTEEALLWRTGNILIGGFIAVIVTTAVIPLQGALRLRYLLNQNIRLLRRMTGERDLPDSERWTRQAEATVDANIQRQLDLMGTATRERPKWRRLRGDIHNLILAQRNLFLHMSSMPSNQIEEALEDLEEQLAVVFHHGQRWHDH